MSLPNNIKRRTPIDPKLAVGSSLPNPRELIALTFLLYLLNDEKEYLDYSVQSGNTIQIKDELIDLMKSYFSSINNYNEQNIDRLRTDNSLVSMQLEPLQVSLQIVLKFAKVKAINSSSSSQERTGGVRVPKSLNFTSNLILLKSILSDDNHDLTESAKTVLYRWIFNEPIEPESQNLEAKLKSALLIFTEDTLYKTWLNDNTEVFFQQEGIYDLINNDTDFVDLKGAKEIKGTLRNLKSLFSHNLHPYLKIDGDNVSLREQALLGDYKDYRSKVANQLDLTPKTIEIVEVEKENELPNNPQNLDNIPHQIIYYGSPGTGKSWEVNNETEKEKSTRVTFHPETDYHSFVGSYRPVMNGDNIRYDFIPQAFTKAYCNAWLNPEQPYFLIIEEINRGNCAQIFGDLFQSLDRDETGYSKYEVEVSTELSEHIKSVLLGKVDIGFYNEKTKSISEKFNSIKLPKNLYIYATMNTSDQSLFPMDSAFKRRWDWKFVPIDYRDADLFKVLIGESIYSWRKFIENINPKIKELTGSEDKQLGNRFVNPKDGNITFDQFRSKVLFYLWSEVYKDEFGTQSSIFKYEIEENNPIDFQFGELYNDNATDIIEAFLKFNGVESEQ
ncbi:MAG: ATPase family protein [Crocinitomicaceae bacterium]|jgi:hypothetical protein|nr:ATPase family protein [Crocinitomicaceae bacterium]